MSETILMSLAVLLYAAGSITFLAGLLARHQRITAAATWVTLAGVVPHVAAVIVRWASIGHGPYLGFYEVISSYSLCTMLIFAVVAVRWPRLRAIGIFLAPVAFLLLGAAMFVSKSGMEITASLASGWLLIHVTFAKISYSSFFAAFGVSAAYLARDGRHPERWDSFLSKLPSQDELEALAYRFVSVGFIALTIMIVAGAVWANEAWGRYWGWDPVETWSLVSWLVYAVVLHLRLTFGWHGRRALIAAALALFVMLFALIGVPFVYQTIHAAYMVVN